jgi:hypothetical protein
VTIYYTFVKIFDIRLRVPIIPILYVEELYNGKKIYPRGITNVHNHRFLVSGDGQTA